MERVLRLLDELDAAVFSLRMVLAGLHGLVLVPVLSTLVVTGLYWISGWLGPVVALTSVSAYRWLRHQRQIRREKTGRLIVQETRVT